MQPRNRASRHLTSHRPLTARGALPLLVLALTLGGPLGCPPPDEGGAETDGGAGAGGGGAGGGGAGGGGAGGGGAGGAGGGGEPVWTRGDHPCQAGRTDALLHTEGDTFYVGCGTGATGRGLWRTTDAGASWTGIEGFEEWRINDLDLEADGALVVSGTDTLSNRGIVRLVPAGDAGDISDVWRRGTTVDESFQVGHYAALPDGRALAESLTGGGLVFRPSAAEPFAGVYPFSADGVGHQILSLTTAPDGFWAVGSTISEPPMIFAPGPGGDLPFDVILPLGAEMNGELWGLARVGARFVAVGIDQGINRAILLVSDEDAEGTNPALRGPAGWRRVDVTELVADPSWLRGACGRGDTLVAVGEKQPLRAGTGRVLRSDDAGRTWRDVTPPASPQTWSVCTVDATGRLTVAGADGGFATLR